MFGLSFLNAGILFATLVALVPLLIHLFIKNKPKKIFFSSLRFLTEILEERKKRMTLNQLLLLLLRMLIILCIVLALAKPVLRLPFLKKTNYHPPTAVAFILDTSPSMDYIIGQRTQIQHGLNIIKDINEQLNTQDATIFYTSDNTHNALRSRLIYSPLPENALTNIDLTWTPEPLDKLLLSAKNELDKTKFLHREIYILSDFVGTPLAASVPDLDIPITFIHTFTDSISVNIALSDVTIRKELIDGNLVRIAEFQIDSYSPHTLADQIVRLNLNGTTVAEKMLDFQPFEKKKDFFIINHENIQWNYGYVEVRNVIFLPDNRAYFTFYSDPSPKIAVVSDSGNLPRPIEVLADIFLGHSGSIDTLSPENIQFTDGQRYHFLIFYLKTYTNRTIAMLDELHKRDIKSMLILPPELDFNARNFLRDKYSLEVTGTAKPDPVSVTGYHQWHKIVGDFKYSTSLSLRAYPALALTSVRNAVPLVNTDSAPLILESGDIIVNIDFSKGQNFLSFPAFPIIIYRSFSWISRYDSGIVSYTVGDKFSQSVGTPFMVSASNASVGSPYMVSASNASALISPTDEKYDASLSGFRFTQPGIWTYIDSAGVSVPIAVNTGFGDFSDRHKPFVDDSGVEGQNIQANENYISHVLQADKGFEIWKVLLWACLLFIATEMIMVVVLQRKAT